jgi:MSHA biogenesis protein MshL
MNATPLPHVASRAGPCRFRRNQPPLLAWAFSFGLAAWLHAGVPLDDAPAAAVPAVVPADASQPKPAVTDEGSGTPALAATTMEDKKLYSFRAQDLELKTALALFARANGLNVIPDSDVTGKVTLDIRDLPLPDAMEALLTASDCAWSQKGKLIRVRATETKQFRIDYLRMARKGSGSSSATSSSGGGASGGSGGSSGGGGGGGGGASGGGGGASGGGSGGPGGSAISLSQENPVDFWSELRLELAHLLTERGKESLAINMTAGQIQVTDRPAALLRVADYLNGLKDTVHRQVSLEARLYDVTLNDQFQLGVDWEHAIKTHGGKLAMIGSPGIAAASGGFNLKENTITMLFQNDNTKVLLQALQEQGEVRVISKPSIRTLNNQTALIKVGTETPFFSKMSTYVPGTTAGSSTPIEQDLVTTITVGTILAITPQIADDDWITLDISPVLTSLVGTEVSPSKTTTAPILDIKQASSLIRVRSGNTVVMGGLIQEENAKTRRKIPVVGDIPLLGHLFRGKFDASKRRELVIFITPKLVE